MIQKRKLYLFGLGVLVLVGVVTAWAVARPSRASLGNHGVPVYGRLSGPVPQSETYYVKFSAADGTVFGNGGESVPTGYYLVITDVLMTTDGGSDAAAVVSVNLEGGGQALRLRSTDNGTLNLHFSTPYFILEPGDRLEAKNAWYSDKWAFVNVSGMLVTNVAYLPLTSSNW
mgnify:CR=1 FL=1